MRFRLWLTVDASGMSLRNELHASTGSPICTAVSLHALVLLINGHDLVSPSILTLSKIYHQNAKLLSEMSALSLDACQWARNTLITEVSVSKLTNTCIQGHIGQYMYHCGPLHRC